MIPIQRAPNLLDGVDVVDAGSGEVVALAHGAGGGVEPNFEPLIDAGRDRYRFVGPQYPGVGGTPLASGPLDLDVLADQVVAAGLRTGARRFAVSGLSLGAAVAVTAAVRHPEHVRALVLTVGVAHPDAQSLAVVSAWRGLAAAGATDALAHLLLHASFTAETLAAMGTSDYGRAVDEIRRGYPVGGADHAELVTRADVRPLLAHVMVPTLVVVVAQDRIVLPSTAREFAAIAGAEVLEYSDAGHIFTPDLADRWSADVLDFLDGPGRPAA